MCDFDKDFASYPEIQLELEKVTSAIRSRKASLLENMVKEKTVDILNYNHDGWYPLHEAIDLGYIDIAQLLIKSAFEHDIDILNKWDQTMSFCPKYSCSELMTTFVTLSPQVSFLTLAVKNNQKDMINYLINFYQRNCECNQGIYQAMLKSINQPEVFDLLLSAFPSYVDKSFENLQTLVQYAIKVNQVESVSILLKFKPNLNMLLKVDNIYPYMSVGLYSLAMACRNNDTRIFKLLIDSEANLFESSQSATPTNLFNPVVNSPVLFATVWGSTEIVKFLVENQFNVLESQVGYFAHTNTERVQFQISAIFLAIIHKKYATFEYLLTVVEIDMLGKLQQTSPVIAAVIRCMPKVIDKLLDNGYNIDGTLPYHTGNHYFCGDSMLDNVTMFIDDVGDIHRPVLSVLRSLLDNGVKFTSVISVELVEYCLFYLEEIGNDTLKYLVNVGALEFVFGCDYSISIKAMKKFFVEQINYIVLLLQDEFVQHPRQAWVKAENVQFYINNFHLFVQHTGLFSKFGKQYPYIRENVPALKQLCRIVIRCCVMQNQKTLIPIKVQSWPPLLKNYLLGLQ